jgi:hypothetical protein
MLRLMTTCGLTRHRFPRILVLVAFLFALASGALHPLALISEQASACHDHSEGHLDPARPHDHHHDACAFCHLAQSLEQVTPPAAGLDWSPQLVQVATVTCQEAARPQQAVPLAFAARAPPVV